jgi:hypothetical protein
MPNIQPKTTNNCRRGSTTPLLRRLYFLLNLFPADHVQQPYHDPDDEPMADPIDPSFFDFDNGEALEKEDLKGTLRCHYDVFIH